MKIVVAVPAYGGEVRSQCVTSLLDLHPYFARKGISHEVVFGDASDPAVVRNHLASLFLTRDASHLLFIDSDMVVPTSTVGKLIAADKPVIGADYPKRRPDLQRTMRRGRFADEPPTNHLCRVERLGAGALLIQRCALEALAPTMRTNVIPEDRPGAGSPMFGFFDAMPLGNDYLSDDYAFCQRWLDHGGDVWCLVDEPIGHVGTFTYQATPPALTVSVKKRVASH